MSTEIFTYTLTWTAVGGDTAQANGIEDDDATVMDFANCIAYYAEWDTVGAPTNASNYDFHLVSSADGANWINTASHTTLAGAVAVSVRDGDTKTTTDIPRANVKATIDINAVDLKENEFVILRLVLLNQH